MRLKEHRSHNNAHLPEARDHCMALVKPFSPDNTIFGAVASFTQPFGGIQTAFFRAHIQR